MAKELQAETISITEADVRQVMRDWLDQPGDKCSNLEDLDGCVEWFFNSLIKLSWERTSDG